MTNIKNTRTMSLRLLGILFLLLFGFTLNIEKTQASIQENNISYSNPNWTWTARSGLGYNQFTVSHIDGTPGSGGCNAGYPYTTSPNNLIGNDSMNSGLVFFCISPTEGSAWTIWTYDGGVGTTTGNYDVSYFQISGGQVAPYSITPPDTTTRIIEILPENNDLLSTSTPVTIGYTVYFNEEDLNNGSSVWFSLKNSACYFNNDCNGYSDPDEGELTTGTGTSLYFNRLVYIETEGEHNWDTTINLPEGEYFIEMRIMKGSFCLLGVCFNTRETITTGESSFIVDNQVHADILKQQAEEFKDKLFGNVATSTEQMKAECNITWSGFDFFDCFTNLAIALFLPSTEEVTGAMTTLRAGVLTKFPIGYVYDFVDILATTTTKEIVLINATVPYILPGGGSNITLSLNGVFDDFMNATTSQFYKADEMTDESWGEFTIRYWTYLVYIFSGLYIIRRIMGTGIMPNWFDNPDYAELGSSYYSHKGSVSNKGKSDDSYKLKEYLYKHDKNKDLIRTKTNFNQRIKK